MICKKLISARKWLACSFPSREKRRYLILVICCLAALQSHSQNQTISDSICKVRITGAPPGVIQQLDPASLNFTKAPGNYVNFGIVGNDYKYFLLKLTAADTITGQYVSIDNTSLDAISIYRVYNNKKSRLLCREGYLVPFAKSRNYVWHTIPLEISATPSLYLIALKSSNKNINVKYDILSGRELQAKYQAHDRIIFFYIGAASLILFIISFAIFLFRERVFIIYSGYVICISLWIISHYGYLFPLVYPDLPVLNEIVKPVSSLGAGYFLVVLLSNVFKQGLQSHPWLRKMLGSMQYILPVLCGCMLLLMIHDLSSLVRGILVALWHIGLLFSICLIVFTPVYFVHSGAVAKIFSVAMLVICMVAMLQLFGNSGYINNYFLNEHGITIGCLLQNFIIAYGLFYNLLQENNDKKKQVIALEREHAETLKKLINVQDDERKRIANDLHDNIGPLLAAIKINFRRLVDNKDALQNGLAHKTELIIDDSIAEIRNVAHNLMPKSLSSNGLIETLREYFESMENLYGKKIIFNHQVQSILGPGVQVNLYRIICELVLNAANHSGAEELTVSICSNDECITVSIQDDGNGFNVKSAEFRKSFGLQSAESRIQYMKGKFTLKTAPGEGTLIDMRIPL